MSSRRFAVVAPFLAFPRPFLVLAARRAADIVVAVRLIVLGVRSLLIGRRFVLS